MPMPTLFDMSTPKDQRNIAVAPRTDAPRTVAPGIAARRIVAPRTPSGRIVAILRPLALLVACVAATQCSRYVLPTPLAIDEASPPGLQGRISAVSGTTVSVAAEPGGTPVVVGVSPETSILTAYGGLVFRDELMPGMHVRVWYDEESRSRDADAPSAAVIVVSSLDPDEGVP